MRSVTHNTLFLTGASIIQKALSFIYFTLLARTFSADALGTYSYSLAFTTIFSIMVDGGLTPVLIRYVARKPTEARSFLKKILSIKLLLLGLTSLAIIGAVYTIDAAFSTRTLIFAAAAVMIIDSLNLSVYGTLRGHQDLGFESVGMIAAQLSSLAVVIGVVTLGAPIIFAIVGLGIGSAVNAIIGLVGLARMESVHSAEHMQGIEIAVLAREAAPFALAGVFARGYSFLDVLILGSLTNFATTGSYSIANKLTFVFQFIPLALAATIYPAFSKQIAAGDQEIARKLWTSSQKYLLFCAGLIILVLVSLRLEILGFFGKAHTDVATTLILLALSLVFAFMSYPVGALLNAAGKQKFQTIAMACTLVANITMNLLLIRPFGSEGAAAGALVGNIVLFSVGAWFAGRHVMQLPWKTVLRFAMIFAVSSIVAGAALAFGKPLIQPLFLGGSLMQLVGIGSLAAIGGIIYLALLLALGAFSKAEIQELIDRLKKRV